MSSVKKGTVKTETIIGSAAQKLVTATSSIIAAFDTIKELNTTAMDNSLKIADQEQKISDLSVEYSQKKAEQEFELDLDFKTNQRLFAEKYLTANSLVAVPSEELSTLKKNYSNLQGEFDSKVATEVSKTRAILENNFKNEAALKDAQYQAKEAENLAEIKNLQAQLTFANEQAALWKQSLDSERAAGIERAKASAIGSVNLTGSTGR